MELPDIESEITEREIELAAVLQPPQPDGLAVLAAETRLHNWHAIRDASLTRQELEGIVTDTQRLQVRAEHVSTLMRHKESPVKRLFQRLVSQ